MDNQITYRQFRIRRYKPGAIDPPRFQTFKVAVGPGHADTVLDGLEQIRLKHDPTLMYRHSCHHNSCGTCACQINGTPRLACTTRLEQLPGDPLIIEPLEGFDCIADLVVSMHDFFRNIDPAWSYSRTDPTDDAPAPPQGVIAWTRLEDCIECGCCVSACPEVHADSPFMGPAALTAFHRQYLKSPDNGKQLLAAVGGHRGAKGCQRVLACSRVCPTRVYPARHINELRLLLKNASPSENDA